MKNFQFPCLAGRQAIFNFQIGLSILVLAFLFPSLVSASEIYFEAPAQVHPGQEFEAALMLNTQPQPVNALEATIEYPANLLELREIYDGNSVVSQWIQKPGVNSQPGVIKFSGIIPGGFTGVINPFTKKEDPGKILSLVFKAKSPGQAAIKASQVSLLLNDGKGTPANVSLDTLVLAVTDSAPAISSPSVKDTIPPEPFSIYLERNQNIFNNKWFVAFSAQDKGSGIDHYELAESRGQSANLADLNWGRASSPAVLNGQRSTGYIYVKAVDKAGNQRIAMLSAANLKIAYEKQDFWSIIGVVILVLAIAGLVKFYRSRKQNAK